MNKRRKKGRKKKKKGKGCPGIKSIVSIVNEESPSQWKQSAFCIFPVSAHLMGVVLEMSFTEGGRKKWSLESVPGGYSRHKENHKRTKTANIISPGTTNERQHRMQKLHWELKAAEKGKA